jgi:hypothetical protein
MPGSSNSSSFIPKRGTKKHTRRLRNVNIYILTIVSYVLFFAALGASAFVYFYEQNYANKLNEEIAQMSVAVSDFKEADMQRVQEFDARLRQANNRLENSASVVGVLSAIESATIDTVRFNSLSIEREFDTNYIVEADIDTDSFDSAIFQRDVIAGFEAVEEIEVGDVSLMQSANQSGQTLAQSLSLRALLSVPLSAVPYEAEATPRVAPPTPTSPFESGEAVPVEAVPAETNEEVDDNQEGI